MDHVALTALLLSLKWHGARLFIRGDVDDGIISIHLGLDDE